VNERYARAVTGPQVGVDRIRVRNPQLGSRIALRVIRPSAVGGVAGNGVIPRIFLPVRSISFEFGSLLNGQRRAPGFDSFLWGLLGPRSNGGDGPDFRGWLSSSINRCVCSRAAVLAAKASDRSGGKHNSQTRLGQLEGAYWGGDQILQAVARRSRPSRHSIRERSCEEAGHAREFPQGRASARKSREVRLSRPATRTFRRSGLPRFHGGQGAAKLSGKCEEFLHAGLSEW